MEGLILANGLHTPNEKLEYVIILGAGLNKDKISLSLQHRLDEAIAYHKQYQDTTFIVSGGQGINESISEAEAMQQLLGCSWNPATPNHRRGAFYLDL